MEIIDPIPKNNRIKVDLPNSNLVLILGIISVVTIFCFQPVSIILAIVTLIIASNDNKNYILEPESYTQKSISSLRSGKLLALIALIISVVVFIATIIGAAYWFRHLPFGHIFEHFEPWFY